MPHESADRLNALTYVSDVPDIPALAGVLNTAISDLEGYRLQTEGAHLDRHEIWPGKSRDGRKHGTDAYPWDGASDLETRLVEDKIRTYVAMSTDAMRRSHVQAYPVEAGDMARARIVSSFLKWMATSWIDGMGRYLDQSANHFFEKGLMVTVCGWEQRRTPRLEEFSMESLQQSMPELAELVLDPANDEQIAALLIESAGENAIITEKRAKKALKQLRETGIAQLPTARITIDRPTVRACLPDSEVFFPAWTCDPKRAPWVAVRDHLTAQEILTRVATDGWDAGWADHAIEHCMGKTTQDLGETLGRGARESRISSVVVGTTKDLVEVIHFYQRLIDEVDGSEGIYCTLFCPHYTGGDDDGSLPFAKHYLTDFDEFPVVVTELCSDEAQLYEVGTFPDLIRSAQRSLKVEKDSRIDRNSLATLPEMAVPSARPPSDRGPGRYIGYRRAGEYHYLTPPAYNADAVQMEQNLMQQVDRLLGLDPEDPMGNTKKSYYVQKFLSHQRDVLAKCYDLYKLYGPEDLFFRVTGLPEQMEMIKNEDERLDITVSFDTLQSDPDTVEAQLRQMMQIIPLDQGGRINMDALITYAAAVISPTLASQILQPAEEGAQKLLEQFTRDWTKMATGIRVDAPPNGAGVILPAMQSLQQEQDVVDGLQENEAWRARVENYLQQLQFQIQQTQNAETGRRGAPAAPITLNQAPYPSQNGQP